MKSDKVKAMAAGILKVGKGDVWFDSKQMDKIQTVMTKDDVRGLIKDGLIRKRKENRKSMGRARLLNAKRKKGRKRGFGKRKGTLKARQHGKQQWIKNVRAQREMLKELQQKNPAAVKKIGYRKLYKRVKGGFFKGKNYLKAAVEGKKR